MNIKPSNFFANPLGYGGNQAGHFVMGAVLVSLFSFWLTPHLVWAAFIMLYVFVIEAPQDGGFFDAIEDIGHFSLGGAMGANLLTEIFINPIVPLYLSAGAIVIGGLIRLWQNGFKADN